MNLSPNKLIFITFIIIFIGFNSHSSYALGACETNLSLGLPCIGDYVDLNGTIYKVNASGASSGVFTPNGSDSYLNSNLGGFIGNWIGRAITRGSFWSRVNITNGSYLNYSYGVYLTTNNINWTIRDNNILVNTTGIYQTQPDGTTILNNTITGKNSSSSYGINLLGVANSYNYNSRVTISGNLIQLFDGGIRFENNMSFASVKNNILKDIDGFAVHTRDYSENNIFQYNNISNSYDAFRIDSNNQNISNNWIYFTRHNCLDTDSALSLFHHTQGHNFINNLCYDTISTGAWIDNTTNSNYINNSFLQCHGVCIMASGNSSDLNIQGNLMSLATDGTRCMQINSYASGLGMINITGNNFSNCNGVDYRISTSGSGTIQNVFTNIHDNFYTANPINLVTASNIVNYSFIENTSSFLVLNESNIDSYIYFNYSGIKNFTQVNYIITLNPIGLNYSIDFGNTTYINNINTLTFPVIANQNVKVGLASSAGGCDYPIIANYIGYNKFCGGTYYQNATSSTSAIITPNADNTTIECSGTILIGNSTGRGINTAKSNVIIKGCTIINYNQIIRYSSSTNNLIYNNSISNVSGQGIIFANVNNSNISNNRIYNSTSASSGIYGIDFDNVCNNNLVEDNIIFKLYDNFKFSSGANRGFNNNILRRNNLSLSQNFCIDFTSAVVNNTLVDNNRLLDCGWQENANAIDLWGYYNNISNNYIYNASHQSIDLLQTTDISIGAFNRIFRNYLDAEGSDDKNCIYIKSSNNNSIYNNTCLGRIATDGNETFQFGNLIYLNYISNIFSYPISTKTDTYWFNNTINYYIGNTVQIQSAESLITSPRFENNIYLTGIVKYKMLSETYSRNFSIFEQSTQHIINLSNLGIIYFNSPITKDLTITNNSVYIRGLLTNSQGYSYYSAFYSNQSSEIGSETISGDTFNISMDASSRLFVFSYLTNTEPRYTEIATTITIPPSSITTTSNSIEFNCTGSGVITINNILTNLGGTIYYVYHNGALVETAQTNSYSTDGTCSSWLFTSSDLTVYNSEVKPSLVSAYIAFAQLFAIFLVVVLIGAIIFAIKQFREGNLSFSFDNMFTWLIGGGIIIIFVTILMLILFTIIATTGNILR